MSSSFFEPYFRGDNFRGDNFRGGISGCADRLLIRERGCCCFGQICTDAGCCEDNAKEAAKLEEREDR